MAIRKIIGIETEYGIVARDLDVSAMVASSLLVNAYSSSGLSLRAWDFGHESPGRDARDGWRPESDYPEVEVLMANSVLSNGARFYVDHAHPEVSTPECSTPSGVVLYDRAAEEIIRTSMTRANLRLEGNGELRAYKNNSDGKGNSYGCHENYLVDRGTPFGYLAAAITAHFVSRQVFCGSGKVGVECPRDGEPVPTFQLTQRADFFEEPVGLETTVRRPIVNTRDEPHCDATRFRRLHVIVGDANMSEVATYLKVGTTALVLSAIEDGVISPDLFVEDPVLHLRRISHDPSLRATVPCADGTRRTALDLQFALLGSVEDWLEGVDDDTVGGESSLILKEWRSVLEGLASDPLSQAHSVDWIAKKRVIDRMMSRDDLPPGHPRLKAVDLQYHDMRDGKSVAGKLGLRRMCQQGEVEMAMCNPPPDTRAFFRGECIRRWPSSIASANWDGIVFDTGADALERVPMNDPLKGTKDLVGELLDSAETVRDLLDALDEGNVERVVAEPGW